MWFLGREIILTAGKRPYRFQCLPFSGSKGFVSSGDRDRARGKRKKKNTAKAFCQYLPVCPRSPEPYIFFANPHGCPVCARRHFCCADSPSAGVLRGKAGGSFFYKKFPPPVLFPFLVKLLFVKRLQTFLGEKADFVAGFFQLLAAGAGERQPFLVQANAVLKRKFAVSSEATTS